MRLSKRLSKYSDIEYSYTQNTSIAGKLIRAQAEQIRRMSADLITAILRTGDRFRRK